MGMDIYAGALTRYYARNWKTIMQQVSESHGLSGNLLVLAPDGSMMPKAGPADEEELRTILSSVCLWQAGLLEGMAEYGALSPWPEDNIRPYYTDKPDWTAYGALLLHMACLHLGEPLPKTIAKGWDYLKEPLLKRALQEENSHILLLNQTEWWLPTGEYLAWKGTTPTGETKWMSTTALLKMVLDGHNQKSWQADEETILCWSKTEGFPADATFDSQSSIQHVHEHLTYDTESLAKFAFSILYQAMLFAEKNRTPILLDY